MSDYRLISAYEIEQGMRIRHKNDEYIILATTRSKSGCKFKVLLETDKGKITLKSEDQVKYFGFTE